VFFGEVSLLSNADATAKALGSHTQPALRGNVALWSWRNATPYFCCEKLARTP
jgi:hypothetical protein